MSARLKRPSRRKRDGNFRVRRNRKKMFVMAFETPVTMPESQRSIELTVAWQQVHFQVLNALENGSFQKCAFRLIATMALQGAAP